MSRISHARVILPSQRRSSQLGQMSRTTRTRLGLPIFPLRSVGERRKRRWTRVLLPTDLGEDHAKTASRFPNSRQRAHSPCTFSTMYRMPLQGPLPHPRWFNRLRRPRRLWLIRSRLFNQPSRCWPLYPPWRQCSRPELRRRRSGGTGWACSSKASGITPGHSNSRHHPWLHWRAFSLGYTWRAP